MSLSERRLILCRPQSGLNDFLCEIERCCRYAEDYDRVVLVDSACAQAKIFHDSFANYFVSMDDRLLLDGEVHGPSLENMAVFPPAVQGRVHSYQTLLLRVPDARDGQRRFLATERDSRQPLTFNFRQHYDEQLLIHQQPLGGSISLAALRRMVIHPRLVNGLAARLRLLEQRYIGVHVRHTDYQTDYGLIIAQLEQMPPRQIFLATDNAVVRDEFRRRFGPRLVTFSALPRTPGEPIHLTRIADPRQRLRVNSEAVLDLLTLAFANQLIIARTTTGNVSGYSLLALNLRKNLSVLLGLMGKYRDLFSDRENILSPP